MNNLNLIKSKDKKFMISSKKLKRIEYKFLRKRFLKVFFRKNKKLKIKF